MAIPNVPWLLTKEQQEAVIKYLSSVATPADSGYDLRKLFETKDRAYTRDVDGTLEQLRAKNANNNGNPKKLQNITVPVVMPQIESNTAYLGGVFLSDYPIFRCFSSRENEKQAAMMNAIIAENSLRYGYVRQLLLYFRDGLKYNFSGLEVSWDVRRTYNYNHNITTGKGDSSEVAYQGNKITRLDPYNIIIDPRVAPADAHQEAEYLGYSTLLNRTQLHALMYQIKGTNVSMNFDKAVASNSQGVIEPGSNSSLYYIPSINNRHVITSMGNTANPNWLSFLSATDSGSKPSARNYANFYVATKLYVRIVPSDLKLPAGTGESRYLPQIWKFIIINGSVVIFAERQTNAHDNIPILIGQPNETGLGYQDNAVLDNALPFQQMSSALWNSGISALRRSVYDRIIYNPSLIRKEDIDDISEVSRVPMRQGAFNRLPSEAVHQIPFRMDNLSTTIQLANQVSEMADVASGQNKVQRGQFQKGNKSVSEFDTVMQNSNLRQQMQALSLEYQVLQPLKQILKSNILQYQPDGKQFFDRDTKQGIQVNMNDLRKTELEFVISDGLLTTEKLMSPELMQVFLQTVQAMPQLDVKYDVMGMFIYWLKLKGATWVDEFERDEAGQQQKLQELQAVAQAQEPQQPIGV